jgi:DNA-binding XRE family transcriptional regulator
MAISPTQTFSELFRESRLGKGWTQEAAAREIGVTLKTVQNWESGKHEPRWTELLKVSSAFGWELSVVKEMGWSLFPGSDLDAARQLADPITQVGG